jgi:hypothetical protein
MLRELSRKTLPSCVAALLAAGSMVASSGRDAIALPMDGGGSPVPRTVRKVDNCNDSGAGSLRDAVASAVSGDAIDLTQLACSQITLFGGTIPTPMNDLTLLGPGVGPDASHPLTIYGYLDRIFDHGTGTLTISGLKLAGGLAYSKGGCIFSQGSLVIEDSVVTGCEAYAPYGTNVIAAGGAIYAQQELWMLRTVVTNNTAYSATAEVAYGGGIFASGIVTIEESTISDNKAVAPRLYAKGGGLMAVGVDDVSIVSSTLSGNKADIAGGIDVDTLGHSQIIESTLSGNYASYVGAAYFVNTPVRLTNSTVTRNSAYGYSAAIYSLQTITAESSLIADNRDVALNLTFDICAPLGGGANLITASCQTTPEDTITACPRLTPLAEHGGPTLTHALIAESPGIDKGSNTAGLVADQRGVSYPRAFGAGADIGAYEWQGELGDNIFKSAFEITCDEY